MKKYFFTALSIAVAVFSFLGNNIAHAAVSVGDSYQGGVVGYILQSGDPGYDATTQKGIIAATNDQGSPTQWSNVFSSAVGTTGTALGDGPANTTAIRNQPGEIQSAAAVCHASADGGYNDWYLPSRGELSELYINKGSIGGFSASNYWSSSEATAGIAWSQNFSNGVLNGSTKSSALNVRCARSFVAATLPPTLLAPSSGTYTDTSPLNVMYTLPESPTSGTVTLVFTPSTGSPITLTLGDTMSAAFSITPTAGFVGIADIISSHGATNIPDGTYSVALSYQDSAGDTVGVTTVTGVVISPTDISSAGVTGFTAPATDRTPQSFSDLTPGSSEYTVTGLTWSPTGSSFAASTQYVATVTLTSAAGYEFPGGGIASPTADAGGTVSAGTTTGTGSGNTLQFTDTFPETIPPVNLSTAIISGSTLTLTYNEPLDPNSIPNLGDFLSNFVVDVNSSSVSLQNIAITGDTVVITLSNPVMVTDTVTVSYTPDSNPLESLTGDQAVPLSNQAVTTTPSAPFQVPNFSVTVASSSEIDLTWDVPYDGGSILDGYVIERSEGGGLGGNDADFSVITNPPVGITNFSDTGLQPGTQYNYEIFAVNSIGQGTPAIQNYNFTDAVFPGGDGSSGNPYQVTTCTEFKEIAHAGPVGAHILLEKDLDCTNDGNAITVDFIPFFMGRVDGGGHRIKIATTDGEGLFHATGNLFTLTNLWVDGTISGGTGVTGGVVDNMLGGTLSKVKSTVHITSGGNIVGGITGSVGLSSITIQDSYFDGTIQNTNDNAIIGGIVGRVIRAQYIKNSYSTGTITETGSNADIGGIWGYSTSSFQGYPDSDFSAIAMSATGSNEAIGGLFGFVGQQFPNHPPYPNNYWDVTVTGQAACSASGVTSPYGCNPENANGNNPDFFKNTLPGGPFATWDFTNTWKTVSGGYPELSGLGTDPVVTSVTPLDGATGVSTSTQLVINFSLPMDTNSVILASSPCGGGGCLSYTNAWSNGNKTLTLTPTTILSPGTQYHVEVYSALSAGEFSPASPFLWSFTTATPTPVSNSGTIVLILGCKDPKATNYNPNNGVSPQNSSCIYPTTSVNSVPNVKTTSTSISFTFTKNLKKGITDTDVQQLQKFLDTHKFPVTTTGPGSIGKLTNLFGINTKAALARYQKSVGLPSTGYFGPMTRAYVNKVLTSGN